MGTMAEAMPHAHIAGQVLRTANQAVAMRSIGAPSLSATSRMIDQPNSGLHANAFGRCATHHTVGQCTLLSPQYPIQSPMANPITVHLCQKPNLFPPPPSSFDNTFTSTVTSGSVSGGTNATPLVVLAAEEEASAAGCWLSWFIFRRNGTPPGFFSISSQNVAVNFSVASAKVGSRSRPSSPSPSPPAVDAGAASSLSSSEGTDGPRSEPPPSPLARASLDRAAATRPLLRPEDRQDSDAHRTLRPGGARVLR